MSDRSAVYERNLVRSFKVHVDHFDFGKYAPFYHGTSMKRAKEIKEFGLLTRIDGLNRAINSMRWIEQGD